MIVGNMTTGRVARRRLLELVQALQPQINSSSYTSVPHASAVYAAAAAAVNHTTITSNRGRNGSGGDFGAAGVSTGSTMLELATSHGAGVWPTKRK